MAKGHEENFRLILNMSPKQADVILRGLDLICRTGLGQFERFVEEIDRLHNKGRDDQLTEHINAIKRLIMPPDFGPNASYGISNSNVHDDAKIAYDLLKTIEKGIAVERNCDRITVWHDGPRLHLGSEPIPTLTMSNKEGEYVCLSRGLIEQSERVFVKTELTVKESDEEYIESSKEAANLLVTHACTVKGHWQDKDFYIDQVD